MEENLLEQSFGKNNENLHMENISKENENNLIMSKQLKNYQNQILLLTKRIKEYEQDLINKNSKEENQIKEFMQVELELKNEINDKINKISFLEDENRYLKEQLNIMENNLDSLKNEVKNLITKNKEIKEENKTIKYNNINPKETINIDWNNNNNELLELIKKYSEEISNLKKQNEVLLNTIQNQNNNYSKNDNFQDIKMINNNESIINNYANEINDEIYIISRWIDTYLICEFNKDFDVPPLLNEDEITSNKLNLINFKLLKKTLENAMNNLNNLINKKEMEIMELENRLNEKEINYKEKKKQLSETRKMMYELNTEKEELNKIIKQNEKEKEYHIKNMDNIKIILNNEKENKTIFLSNIYSIINKEINNIINNMNFKSYHQRFIENENNAINLEEKLMSKFNKLMLFLEELKFDYIETKKENYEIIKEKANDNIKILKNENEYNIYKNELEENKREINKLINENKMLKEEIEINKQRNKIKEMNENNKKEIKYEEMKQEIIQLKDINKNIIKKLGDMSEGNIKLENMNNALEDEMEKLKENEQILELLKEKYDNLSFDYNRIQKENTSLKNLINNQ